MYAVFLGQTIVTQLIWKQREKWEGLVRHHMNRVIVVKDDRGVGIVRSRDPVKLLAGNT